MNEPMPPWRSFSSDAPQSPAAGSSRPEAGAPRSWPRWLVPLLAALGGLAAAALAGALLLLALAAAPTAPVADALGESLELGPGALAAAAEPTAVGSIVVDVAGAVTRPGLHRLTAGARVGDAIEAAGGFAPRADLAATSQALNLAQPLDDGAKVLVPELGNATLGTPAGAADGRIDLNGATASELESLPGIGPVTAGKIIAARQERRFDSVPDLRARGLVGEKVYADVKDLVFAG
ncbi:MAG: ComEA family DNA-binding protein [Chloroflexota bacterium]